VTYYEQPLLLAEFIEKGIGGSWLSFIARVRIKKGFGLRSGGSRKRISKFGCFSTMIRAARATERA
jgi:hypothetical protein